MQELEPNQRVRISAKLRNLCFSSDYIPEPVWRWFPVWLAVAFVLRAILALSGDFLLHPDENQQYLEPAHRLVFGNGLLFWEYAYGARSWLVPGLVAGILWLSDTAGLGEPWFYVDAVKLMLCLLSLLIPWGVYHYGRSIVSEAAARLALILACVWPYLIAYAHKPFTEFVATDLLLLAFGLAALPASRRTWPAAGLGFLIALAGFVRYQYIPIVGLLWLAKIITLKPRSAVAMLGGSLLAVVAVGMLEWYSWGGFFHSYWINFVVNLTIPQGIFAPEPFYYYLPRLLYATCGGILIAVWAMARDPRRYFVLMICMLVLFSLHSFFVSHKEFRFIFLLMPLWFIPFAGWFSSVFATSKRLYQQLITIGAACAFSLLVLTNSFPLESWLHSNTGDPRPISYLGNEGNMFEAYRLLAELEHVQGVYHFPDTYTETPGYYYLHHKVPFYDFNNGVNTLKEYNLIPEQMASHIVTDAELALPGFVKLYDEGGYKVYELRTAEAGQVIPWQHYHPTLVDPEVHNSLRFIAELKDPHEMKLMIEQ